MLLKFTGSDYCILTLGDNLRVGRKALEARLQVGVFSNVLPPKRCFIDLDHMGEDLSPNVP